MDKNLQDELNEFCQMVKEVFNEIKNSFYRVVEIHKEIEEQNELRKTWHVPKDTTRCHQVLINKPLFSRIRNQI